jgi:hypothetical protein
MPLSIEVDELADGAPDPTGATCDEIADDVSGPSDAPATAVTVRVVARRVPSVDGAWVVETLSATVGEPVVDWSSGADDSASGGVICGPLVVVTEPVTGGADVCVGGGSVVPVVEPGAVVAVVGCVVVVVVVGSVVVGWVVVVVGWVVVVVVVGWVVVVVVVVVGWVVVVVVVVVGWVVVVVGPPDGQVPFTGGTSF